MILSECTCDLTHSNIKKSKNNSPQISNRSPFPKATTQNPYIDPLGPQRITGIPPKLILNGLGELHGFTIFKGDKGIATIHPTSLDHCRHSDERPTMIPTKNGESRKITVISKVKGQIGDYNLPYIPTYNIGLIYTRISYVRVCCR